jgi:hypothetical protein
MSDDRSRPARWQYWSHMITAAVWQAVALSFGAEPMTVRGLALDCRDGEFDECPPDFRDRLEIACNHIETETLRAEGAGQIPFRKVALAEFSEWALAPSRNWRLPKEFPRNPGRTATPGDKAAGDETATALDSPELIVVEPTARPIDSSNAEPTERAVKTRQPRRDEKRGDICRAIVALRIESDWTTLPDKDRCRRIDSYLDKSNGWCKVITLRRATADLKTEYTGPDHSDHSLI